MRVIQKLHRFIREKICLDTEDKLLRYLAYVKVGADDPMSEKSQAYQEFVRLLTHAKEIIAKMYQGDEVEKVPQ